MAEREVTPSFFVFSDDIDWCRKNFTLKNFMCEFVDQSLTGPNAGWYLQLIAACKHFIIPNSTYGWWGAWHGKHPGKIVIAPRIWYKGQSEYINAIIPGHWISL